MISGEEVCSASVSGICLSKIIIHQNCKGMDMFVILPQKTQHASFHSLGPFKDLNQSNLPFEKN